MDALRATRLSLHCVAELLIAGPQYAAHGTIKLRVTSGGFGSWTGPEVRVQGAMLRVGSASYALNGRTVADVAAEAGIVPRALSDVFHDGVGLTADHVLSVDAA